MLKDLLISSRSYRRFSQETPITAENLRALIELTRYTPSTVNSQPLRFMAVCNKEDNAKVFGTLAWAGLLKDWPGPAECERPTGYIIILCDKSVGTDKRFDDGIAAQTIMLGAREMGFGGCILGAVNREKLALDFDIDTEKYSVDLVLALGTPAEEVKITDINKGESTAYYRDEKDSHIVPKIKLEDIIL